MNQSTRKEWPQYDEFVKKNSLEKKILSIENKFMIVLMVLITGGALAYADSLLKQKP